MSTGYKIDFTDQNANRSFELAPFTTNGPVTPNDETLDARATDAASTLLLYGKGAPDYGERIQENMLHQLENFANNVEPAYPVHGQFWLDTSVSPAQLRIYNAFRYAITDAEPPNNNNHNWFAITPTNPDDETEQVARFVVNKKVTIIDGTATHNKERYSVTTTAAVNASLDVEFAVTPTPASSRNGWYIGGWEYVLQNNSVLRDDWILTSTPGDPTAWTISNVRDPLTSWEVANKNYVDAQIALAIDTNNELAELNDTNIVAPANQELLIYNSTSSRWENRPASDAIISTAGGTMSGDIDMAGLYSVINMRYPTLANEGAHKQYVDDQIAAVSGGVPTLLNDLADVNAPTPTNNQILEWTGGQWKNIDPATFIATNDIITTAGGTFTGAVYLPGPSPLAPNESAHKQYVDDAVAAGILAAGDGVINSLTFDNNTKVLRITTTNATIFEASLAGASGTSADFTHEVLNPNQSDQFPGLTIGHALENYFYPDPDYPDISMDKVVREYSVSLGRHATPKPKIVLVVDNATGTVVNMTSSDLGPTQCHAPLAYADVMPYVVGQNRLMVWVNGVKQIADEHGVVHVLALDTSGGSEIGLWHGMETGLNDDTTPYTFDVNVDGTGFSTYSVQGQDAQRMGNLVDAINAVGLTATPKFSCILFEGIWHFYSAIAGAGSSIDVTNGASGTNLFGPSGIVGNAGTTGTIYVDLTKNIFNFTTPTNYSYKETGIVGLQSNVFQFNSTLPLGAIIEVLIEIDMFNRN